MNFFKSNLNPYSHQQLKIEKNKLLPFRDGPFNHVCGIEATEVLRLSRGETEIEKYQTYVADNEPHDLNGSRLDQITVITTPSIK